MKQVSEDQWWQALWEERFECLRTHLDPMMTPDQVVPFEWESAEEATPGGCAIAFAPRQHPEIATVVSMGLTQPLSPDEVAHDWEFAIHTRNVETWCYRLIRDLMIGWRLFSGLSLGHFLPVSFFRNAAKEVDCVTAEMPSQHHRIGSISGLYLWPSLVDRQLFETRAGNFHLMAVTLVSKDEEQLADQTSPPHLLLLLKELGHLQPCDPWRDSILNHTRFAEVWQAIRQLSHDEAFDRLCA